MATQVDDLRLLQKDPNFLIAPKDDDLESKRGVPVSFSTAESTDDNDKNLLLSPDASQSQELTLDDFDAGFAADQLDGKKIPPGVYYAKFHKPTCCSYSCIQKMRLIFAALCTPIVLASVIANGPLTFVEYATQWTSMMTFIYFLLIWQSARIDKDLEQSKSQSSAIEKTSLSINAASEPFNGAQEYERRQNQTSFVDRAASDPKETSAYRWRKVACQMQQITVAWQFIIVFVFWAFCAAQFLPAVGPMWQSGLIASHTLPFLFVLLNLFMTDSQMKLGDWWQSFIVAITYIGINYYFTETGPEPVYPFLTWEKPLWSLLWCLLSFLFGTICQAVCSYILERKAGRKFSEAW